MKESMTFRIDRLVGAIVGAALCLTLLLFTSSQCFAEMTVQDISKERAKEFGVAMRSRKNGDAGVAVLLEFKTQGVLKDFSHVELEIGDGENRIMSARLLASHPSPGSVAVNFSAYPAYLPKSTLTIVVSDPPLGGSGYRFKVKDFVELGKSPQSNLATDTNTVGTAGPSHLSPAAETPYDYRASDAYGKLSTADRQRLEQVHRDLVLLWGALDMYADQHNGNLPAALDELVPRYLAELPSDPFATPEIARAQTTGGYTQSKGGLGYRFMRGAPGNPAWVISSVGLPDFPYLAERGNVGLYVGKGTWISGIITIPAVGRAFNAQPDGPANGSQPIRSETNRTSSSAGSRR